MGGYAGVVLEVLGDHQVLPSFVVVAVLQVLLAVVDGDWLEGLWQSIGRVGNWKHCGIFI